MVVWGSQSWESVSRKIRERIANGDEAGGLKIATAYAKAKPEDVRRWSAVARLSGLNGDLAASEAALRTAVRLAPDDPWLRYRLGKTADRRGHVGQARARYTQLAGDADPSSPGSFLGQVGLAGLAVGSASWDEAKERASRAEVALPEAGAAITELAMVVASIPGEEVWAERVLRMAVAREGGPAAFMLLAAILERRGDPEAAEAIERAREKSLGDPRMFDEEFRGIVQRFPRRP